MKLKTLKDIEEDFLQNKGYHIFNPIAIKLLRKEAINWIKDIKEGKTWTDWVSDECPNHDNLINWIIHFFNITEEDLK